MTSAPTELTSSSAKAGASPESLIMKKYKITLCLMAMALVVSADWSSSKPGKIDYDKH